MAGMDANAKLEGAFLELVNEKPFDKITVNDIVERAGVHRNTFYYHYQSIPIMLGEVCDRLVNKMFDIYGDVRFPADSVLSLVKYTKKHKSSILHVYHSEARPILLDYVRKIGGFAIERFIDTVTDRKGISRHDREIMSRFYTAGIVGVWTDWVEAGIETDASEDFIRIGHFLEKTTLDVFTEE